MKPFAILLGAVLVLQSCSSPTPKKEVYLTGIDTKVKPGDNFFRYVNGIWYDSVQIPASQSGVGAYMFMNYPQRLRMQGLLDSLAQLSHPQGSTAQKVADFYASGLDTVTIEERGYEPVKPMLQAIQNIESVPQLMAFVAQQTTQGNASLINFRVDADDHNSRMNIGHLHQTGTGLPNRDYYFKKDPTTLAIQEGYKSYLAQLFQLIGEDTITAKQDAHTVFGIETQIATSHRTRVELRDIKANYNKMAVADLQKNHPNIGWNKVLGTMGAQTDSLDVGQPGYYNALNGLLTSIPLSDWKTYLMAHTLTRYAGDLSSPFVDADFAFTKILTGKAAQKPRKERMVSQINGLLGMALAKLYVERYFPESAKVRMQELVENVQKAYAVRIDKLEWMSDSTKLKAKEKLAAITKKIGYPDHWQDYDNVDIVPNHYFENLVAASAGKYQFMLAKLDQPVDRTEWQTTPPTVTAYNNPPANEIVFPAGILQPPYFNNDADDALNYGGIGMVIGHELTHTFDDQGAQYDKDGNVKNWWTDADYEKFKAKTQQVIDLYNGFTVLDTLHINGAMTVGENTADLSGVRVAYDAFKMTPEGQDTTKINGYTPDQRFFMSVARIWRVKMKDEFLRYWIQNNPHSPPLWRVNGPLMNVPAFYPAFNVQPGDSLYLAPEDRVAVW